jgi:hypothetical protein
MWWCHDGFEGAVLFNAMGYFTFNYFTFNMLAFLVIVVKTIQMELIFPNYF